MKTSKKVISAFMGVATFDQIKKVRGLLAYSGTARGKRVAMNYIHHIARGRA